MYFFTSDLHFRDNDTLKMDSRPFKTFNQFDKFVLKLWNKQATKSDTIFVVGDFVDCNPDGTGDWQKALMYVKKIKANVVLILGNNEERVIKFYFNGDFNAFKNYCMNLGFKDVLKDLDLEFKNNQFFLTHKPINHKEGVINLFGHIHRSTGIYRPFGFNIGCDNNHFRLYSETDILGLIEMRDNFWLKDKNVNIW